MLPILFDFPEKLARTLNNTIVPLSLTTPPINKLTN